ncbi:hypothetical protein CHLRE_03g144204v5 [Chlamydomonas reinhardtii]|uniref:Glycolipid transfer protein domain-containing protein n=1 Tax=Chlamydomonas reinhardtii TaxID=3055 RepID=A0A2K3DV34_CHLRE|nr:uncharacterized protein CHLRE_03g144204v5 [Chlamydomonas reinhardtii]PNW84401.1 hypothetical protein CHLRE_03g144204v5 [Chlamydomonas reinhardtii]
MTNHKGRYLEGLSVSLKAVHEQGDDIQSADFARLCDHILEAFDHLGTIMYFAKVEMGGKVESIRKVSAQLKTLREVVDADVRAGRATTKGSCARNLHRLMLVITFVRLLLQQLLDSPSTQLKDALWVAYKGSLHPIHTYMVQTAVWAGLGMVPSRAAFMASIGEDEDSARQHVPEVLAAAAELAGRLERMYGGTVMPASDLTYIPAAPAAAGATM